MSCMTVWVPRPEQRLSAKFFGRLPFIRSDCAVFLPSFRRLLSADCRSVAQLLTCGLAVHVRASYNILDSMQRTKAQCMPTFMSKSFFLNIIAHILIDVSERISVSIIVAFVARGLSNIPGDLFCYSAVSSAGVVVILPGFTI